MGITSFSQQHRAGQDQWEKAPKGRVNFGLTLAAAETVTLTPPTAEQLGEVRGPATPENPDGQVRLPGAPMYNLIVRRPEATPDPDRIRITVDADGTGALVSGYVTPFNGGSIEVLEIPAGAVVRTDVLSGAAATAECSYVIPQLTQY